MSYQATLPWADSKRRERLDGEKIGAPDDGHKEIRPWERPVVSFEVKVYVHTQVCSASIEEGVQAFPVFAIISKAGPNARKWRIDSIDLESLDAYKGDRNAGVVNRSVFRAVAVEMWRRGFNPLEIVGWANHASGWDYKSILEEAWSQR